MGRTAMLATLAGVVAAIAGVVGERPVHAVPPLPPPVRIDLGCAASNSAEDLTAHLGLVGPRVRFDAPHVYPLGGDRFLWLVNDAFIDSVGGATRLGLTSYVNNVALEQVGTCFTLIHRGSVDAPQEFEPGTIVEGDHGQFFWPLGGTLEGGVLTVVWAQMLDDVSRDLSDGIRRHPIATWYAQYDPQTLERIDMRPMRNSGVFPQYGSAVESVGPWTYLFGNTNLLNYYYEGGFYGDHSSTRMYLARIPRGQFDELPEYWDGTSWATQPVAAAPISERFIFANQMQVRYLGGRWIAVTKEDEFVGDEIVVDTADEPWGPWVTTARHQIDAPLPSSGNAAEPPPMIYHPFILPWSDERTLDVAISTSTLLFAQAADAPELYRSFVVELPMPPAAPVDD